MAAIAPRADIGRIAAMLAAGMTYRAIGGEFGLSGCRIQQIAGKAGLRSLGRSARAAPRRDAALQLMRSGLAAKTAARKTGYHPLTLANYAVRHRIGLVAAKEARFARENAAAIEAIRAGASAYSAVGKVEGALSRRLACYCRRQNIGRYARPDPEPAASSSLPHAAAPSEDGAALSSSL